MNCPRCNFRFGALSSNGDIPDLAPLVCENCGAVSMLQGGAAGSVRAASPEEIRLLQESPAWHNVIEPVRRLLLDTRVAPADRSKVVMTDGGPVVPGYRELRPDGRQKGYVVLSDEERARGFVRPVRLAYTHLVCGSDTSMHWRIAETYARDPRFYGATYCCACSAHFPVAEFVWKGTNERVGS